MNQGSAVTRKLIATLSVLAIAGCATVTDRQSSAKTAQAERNFPPQGQFLDVDGRRVHVVVEGAGPDLIMLHGAGGNAREFTFEFLDRFKDNYRVIIFDRPGLGYTDQVSDVYERRFSSNAETPAEQAQLLHAAATQLGAENAILLGHSFGATVALAWALDYPDDVAGVVNLAGPSHPWPGRLGAFYTVNGSALGGAVVPPLISAIATERQISTSIESIFAPQPVPDGYVEHIGGPLTIRPDSFRANARQVNTLRPQIVEMAPRYVDELTMPLEIIHGDMDQTVPLEIHSIPLSEAVPHAKLTVLDGVGHMPHHARPDVVEQAVGRISGQAQLR